MSKLGIIVDGQGDFASMRARFKDKFKILKTDGPRGHTVSVSKIVSGSRKQVGILKALRYSEVIILLDYEMRTISHTDFVNTLVSQFKALALGITIHVVVPNMMIENWYLADIEYLSKKKNFIRDGLSQKKYEGKHGKDELKKLIVKGVSYNEVTHGSQMFSIIRFTTAKKNSPSFKVFHKIIEPHLRVHS